MRVAVHTHGVLLSADGREHVCEKVRQVLGRIADRLTAVRVFVADVNGPRGGVDKTCTVTMAVADGPPVTVVQRGETVTGALDGVLARARRAAKRVLRRRADERRGTRFGRLMNCLLQRRAEGLQ